MLHISNQQKQSRNSIIGEEYRWPTTIPYYMGDDLGEFVILFHDYFARSLHCIILKAVANQVSKIQWNACNNLWGHFFFTESTHTHTLRGNVNAMPVQSTGNISSFILKESEGIEEGGGGEGGAGGGG